MRPSRTGEGSFATARSAPKTLCVPLRRLCVAANDNQSGPVGRAGHNRVGNPRLAGSRWAPVADAPGSRWPPVAAVANAPGSLFDQARVDPVDAGEDVAVFAELDHERQFLGAFHVEANGERFAIAGKLLRVEGARFAVDQDLDVGVSGFAV